MASRWIVKRGEKQAGPFTSPQLRGLALSGQLRRSDRVTRQGSNRFVNAEEVRGLTFPDFAEEVPDDLEYGTVEIIDEGEPVILVPAVDEPKFVDYIYDADDDDDEKPEPVRSRRSKNVGSPSSIGPSRRSSRLDKPARRKPARKKAGGEEEDDDDGPWTYLISGVASIGIGIGLAYHIDETTDVSGRHRAFQQFLLFLYSIGGRWLVFGLFFAIGLWCLYCSTQKFMKR
jgi:hypothetical protein